MKKKLTIDFRMHNASGIGRYIRNLVPFLVDEFDITLLGKKEELQNYSFVNKVKIIESNSNIYSIKEQIELFKKIPQSDIFWSPHYNIPILPIKAKKRIVTIHDVYHLAFYDNLSLSQKIYSKFMINQAVKKSDIVLTVSNFSKKEIIKYTNTNKNIEIIYNGIEKDWISNDIYPKENYILYVGNVKPHKNLVRALKAFLLLKNKNIKFKIVGKKEGFITADTQIDKIAKELGNRVEFTGYVSDDELKKLYQKAKFFLFPSLYEGFGIPPLEAQACGTPVIVSNVASLPEVCQDSTLYCNPYDIYDIKNKMEQLINNETLQEELVQKGFENIKRFSWEKSANKLIKIIEGLK